MIWSLISYSQSLEGSYKSVNGSVLILNIDQTFYYHKKKELKNIPVIENFSISEGGYKISDNFILLNSDYDLSEKVDAFFTFKQNASILSNVIKINFNKKSDDFDVYICNIYAEEYDLKLDSWLSNVDNCLKLERVNEINKNDFGTNIYFKIFPKFESSFIRTLQLNLSFLKTKEYNLDINKNIEVHFNEPNVDLFYYQFFDNEIAIIEKNYIFFKGEKFYKYN